MKYVVAYFVFMYSFSVNAGEAYLQIYSNISKADYIHDCLELKRMNKQICQYSADIIFDKQYEEYQKIFQSRKQLESVVFESFEKCK